VLGWLEARGVKTAVITRNSRVSAETVLRRHGLRMEVVVTREDAAPKPDPRALWLACERLGVGPAEAWMVGDGQYDVEAGVAAGILTVWVSHGSARRFEAEPWREVRDLCELQVLLGAALGE
jgi:phosphoglycolate phosphatase-like HAD superfamily hydrolase